MKAFKYVLSGTIATVLVLGGLPVAAHANGSPVTYSCATGEPSAVSPTYGIDISGAVVNGTDCTGEVIILAAPTSIGRMAFQSSSLTSINIPETVTLINEAAFNASGITSITIPASVESIGDYAFAGAYDLASINILEGVESIGAYAFSDADALTEITIPASVTSIGDYAFASSDFLSNFYFAGNAPSFVGVNAFSFYKPRRAYIQPSAMGFQVSDLTAFGYGDSYLEIYWEGLILRPNPPYVSSVLFREWETLLLPTQTGPKVGDTVYASAFERGLDLSLLSDVSGTVNRPEEYVYRITKQENDVNSSVDQQSHDAYESLTKAEQDSWYGEMGFDTPTTPGIGPYQFSWRAFICLDDESGLVSKPTNLAVSHASRDDTTDFYMGDQRRQRDFMFRDLTMNPLFSATRTLVGSNDSSLFAAGPDTFGTGFALGVTEVTAECDPNGGLLALPILDVSGSPITTKSFVIPENLNFGEGIRLGSAGVTIGVTGGGGPTFEAALFGLTTIASATPSPSGSSSQYVVTFDANGGYGDQSKIVGSSAALLPANKFSKKGYVFAGWNTKADGSGVALADQASFSFSTDLVLFAQWSLVAGKKIIRNFAANKPTLTAIMKNSIAGWVKTLPRGAEFVCQGSTSGTKATAFHKKLAANRAKNVCLYAVKVRKDLTYKIVSKPASSSAVSARKVSLYLN